MPPLDVLALLDGGAHKLKCLIQEAEIVKQFLALVMRVLLHRELEHQHSLVSSQWPTR